MSETSHSVPRQESFPAPSFPAFKRGLALCFLLFLLGILAFNLFLIVPFFASKWGPGAGNLIFIGVRVVAIILCSFLVRRYTNATRFQALCFAAILAFVDHVGFKGIYILKESQSDPGFWQEMGKGSIVFGLLASFMISSPIILLLAFVGAQLGSRRADGAQLSSKRVDGAQPGSRRADSAAPGGPDQNNSN